MPAANLPSHQNAIVITAAGGPEVLELVERPVARPAAGEVLIAVRAAGINRHDCHQRRAGPARHPGNPVPGLESSGTIIAVGDGVSPSRIGEEVVALTDGGSYAQFVVTHEALALPKPKAFDWNTAVALPEALFTVWHNLFGLARLSPGERVLVHGGTSGVGSIGIQALTALGYEVFATSGDERKRIAAQELGARAAFNYRDPDLARQVRAATGDAGIDVILDMSAGAHLSADLDMLAHGGRITHLSSGGKDLSLPLQKLMAKQISVTGSLLRPLALPRKAKIAERLKSEIWPLLETRVRPVIAGTFPLEDAVAAHREMEDGQHIGKLVLTVAPTGSR